jgi:hypothetical protein
VSVDFLETAPQIFVLFPLGFLTVLFGSSFEQLPSFLFS